MRHIHGILFLLHNLYPVKPLALIPVAQEQRSRCRRHRGKYSCSAMETWTVDLRGVLHALGRIPRLRYTFSSRGVMTSVSFRLNCLLMVEWLSLISFSIDHSISTPFRTMYFMCVAVLPMLGAYVKSARTFQDLQTYCSGIRRIQSGVICVVFLNSWESIRQMHLDLRIEHVKYATVLVS
jgi:hypothetical protein